jgi:hypothetical protein
LEPISYLGAPARRWPVIVAIALIAMIIALLVPVHVSSAYPANTWRADAQVGLAPPYNANKLGAKVGLKQVEFYAHSPVVLATAARTAGVPYTSSLKNDVVVTKSKTPGQHSSTLLLAVLQPTKGRAVSLTNAFTAALGAYAQVQLADNQKNDLYIQQLYIQNLQNAINSLPKHQPATATTTPTTTAPIKIKKVVVKPTKTATTAPVTTTTKAPKTTTTAKASDRSTVSGSLASLTTAGHQASTGANASAEPVTGHSFILVQTTVTTPPTIPGSTTVTTPPTIPGSTTVTTPTSGSSGSSASLSRAAVAAEGRVLADELGQAVAVQQRLKAQGVPQSGYKVISPAQRSAAVRLNPNPPLLANGWARLLLGLLAGALMGVVVTWLLDGFDRRLRTAKRAEEVFGLPVVAEIPSPGSKTMSVIPVVDIVVDSFSETSEAYRKLHVAILTAPAVTWVKRGSGGDRWEAPVLQLQPLPLAASAPAASAPSASAPAGNIDDTIVVDRFGQSSVHPAADRDTMRVPVAVKTPQITVPRRSRFAILITSPNDEPTRSLVVVNLAAVFAEAGDRVLVATTGGMRTEFEGNGKGPHVWESEMRDTNASDLVANARPSQIPGVSSLALGQVFSNPSRLALKAGSLVEAARDIVDVLLIESPLLSTQDGAALLPVVDLVVVVGEAWHTTVAEGRRTQSLLAQRRPPVLGLVMTNMPTRHPVLQ